ncbi:MAG: PAS domain S-box protein [Dehalococcoidia bacterium]|jgi:diguanylate cyclase (GGDEF)-like protein/PAS domain S-box-containing protein
MKWPGLLRLDGYLPEGMEREYRRYHLKDDVRTASISIVIITILLVAFAYNDYALFGLTPTFYYLIAIRSIYLFINIGLIISLQKNRSPVKFDWNLLIWFIFSGLVVSAINLTRPNSYIGDIPIDVVLILIIYLGVPMRLMFRATGGILFMLAESLNLLFLHRAALGTTIYASLVALLMANIIGIYASSRLYSFRRSEFKAREEESHTLSLLNETGKMASVGGWEFDVKRRLQTWTDEVYRIHEMEPGRRITADEGIKYYSSEAVPVISEAVLHAVIFGEPFDLELPLITAKGNRRWVHAVGKAYSENGLITRVGGTIQDITAVKKAEDIIKKTSEQWRTTFDAISDLVSIQDKDFRLIRVNKAYADAFQVRPEELIGKHCYEIVHMSSVPIPNCPHEKAVECKSGVIEEVFEPRLGMYMEVSCSPIFNDKGELEGTVHIVKNITERKKADEKLRESEKQYREMLDFLPISAFEIDTAAKIISFNQTALKVFGYSEEDYVAGMNASQFFSPKELQRFGENFEKVMEGKSIPGDEYSFLRKDGSTFIGLIYATSVFRQNKLAGVRGAIVDITRRKQIEEERQKASERIQDLYNNAPAGYHSLDKDGVYVQVNDTELAWIGYTREEVIGKIKFVDLLSPASREDFAVNFPLFKQRGWLKDLETEIVRKDGTVMAALVSATAVKDEAGNFLMSRTTLFDITEVRRLQKTISESEKRFRTILEEMNDSYFELDLAGNFTFVNNAFCRVLRVTREEVIGANFRSITILDEINDILSQFVRVRETGEPHKGLIFRLARKDGVIEFAEISISPQKDEHGNVVGYRCVGRDVTERMELQNKLAVLAMHDALTGLPNRSLLYDRFNIACAQAQRNKKKLAAMELDLDNFKTINDTLGHAAGDELLKATADRLTALVRKSDTVARLGGDEFVVLIPEFTNIKDVIKAAQKILAAFQKPFAIDGRDLQVTTSIGIAIYPRDGSNIEDLLKVADAAMYYTKEHGRNSYKVSVDKARACTTTPPTKTLIIKNLK